MSNLLSSVSRETMNRLEIYQRLLEEWSPRINLVSLASLDDAWGRHFKDSSQLMNISATEQTNWVDLGSGGGFPGAVIAILSAETVPNRSVTLIESDQRKCAFLRTVLRKTGVAAKVTCGRIEAVEELQADIISARALAPLPKLLDLASRHGNEATAYLFMKGRTWKEELIEAKKNWQFTHRVIPSEADPEGVILRIESIEHV